MRKSNFKNHLKNYFTFSKAEKNGIVILLVILVLFLVASALLPESKNRKATDYADFQKEVDSLFTKKEVVDKHNISFLPDSVRRKPLNSWKIEKVNINSCDSAELIKLPGIGPVLASRIIKYRKILGGYYNKSQLLEVYGLQEENFKKAATYILTYESDINAISVDTSGFRTLLRHPYIGKEKARKIIDLRKKLNNNNIEPEDLQKAEIFDSAQWARVKHYLIFTKK